MVKLGRWPTPVDRALLPSGRTILVKRDDLSGFGRSGAKTRKLETFLGSIQGDSHEEVVTSSGNASNLAHDLDLLQAKVGIRFRLFVSNHPKMSRRDRENMFDSIRVRKHFLGTRGRPIAACMTAYRAYAALCGRRILLTAPGLAVPASVVGAAKGYLEMHRQLADPPRAVFISAASGGTLAGLILAETLLCRLGKLPTAIIGVTVGWGLTRDTVHRLVRQTETQLDLDQRSPPESVVLNGDQAHHGFGRFDAGLQQRCESFDRVPGLQLDPIYSGKTWAVMERCIDRSGPARDDGAFLFWHCGYTPNWRQFPRSSKAQ